MLYAILCYDSQDLVFSWSQEEDAALMAKLDVVQRELAAMGKLGPVARLMPTTRAKTVRGSDQSVTDGPFAETKEQLLGFYVVDFESEQEAVAFTQRLAHASGALELRPLLLYRAADYWDKSG